MIKETNNAVTLTATTEAGTFTRRTKRTYSHIVVADYPAYDHPTGPQSAILNKCHAWVGRPELVASRMSEVSVNGWVNVRSYPVD